jgi:hypothetical protein
MPQYSAVGTCAAIVDLTSIQCALYCKFGVKYSSHRPVYAVWIVVPDYTKYLQLRLFMLQYSAAGICCCYCRYHTQFNARYTANLVPNTAHIVQFTLYELWFPPYTKYLQLLIVRPRFSTERICAAIGDIPTLRCALYCKLGVKYSAHRPVYAVWTVVPDVYKVFTAPHI